jgi:polyphosphate kinase
VGRNAPVVRSLMEAQRSKQVAVLVELERDSTRETLGGPGHWKLKAFVVYSLVGLKTLARLRWWCAKDGGRGVICTSPRATTRSLRDLYRVGY